MNSQIEESGDRWQEWFKSSQYYDAQDHRDQHGLCRPRKGGWWGATELTVGKFGLCVVTKANMYRRLISDKQTKPPIKFYSEVTTFGCRIT
ncbi:MAG: hypothetical protein QF569_28515 [Candidatus Poribacteria bacterium]|nr:hypothetical protein [Candidatus Poribacteria bacterium]